MMNSTTEPLVFSSVCSKRVTGVFDDHGVTSDAGVLSLREVEQRIGVIDALTDAIVDSRHPSYVRHEVRDMTAQGVFQITLGYEDANPAEGGSDPSGQGLFSWRGSAVRGDQCIRPTEDHLREALLLARLRGIDDQGA